MQHDGSARLSSIVEKELSMKFSAWLSASTPWSDLLDEFRHAERTGWDGAWIADHFMPNAENNLGPCLLYTSPSPRD